MDFKLYFAFIAVTTLLMLIPGPNAALIVANSFAHGRKFGLVTVLGTTLRMAIQLLLASLGMSQLLGVLAESFSVLR